MLPVSAGRSTTPRARPPLSPLERTCARAFRDAISHLHELLARLERPSPDVGSCRREMEEIVDHTAGLSRRMLTAMLDQGMRADPAVRQVFFRCSETAARVHRAIQRAERRAARRAQLEADLFSQERWSPGWET